MDQLIVCPKDGEAVSRAFSVRLVGYVTANGLWELGRTGAKAERPVWLAYAGTDAQVRAFTANARKGRRLRRVDVWNHDREQLEVPKSARFRCDVQRTAGGSVATLYHPTLCGLEPLIQDAERIEFLSVVPARWVDEQEPAARAAGVPDADVRTAIVAARVMACLDRRCPLPIVGDLTFHLRVFRSGLDKGVFRQRAVHVRGTPQVVPDQIPSVEAVVACCVSQETFSEFLRAEIAQYFGERHGTP